MKNYSITKYKGNTHYSVNVTDSYGRQKGSFFRTETECHEFIYKVWQEELPKSEQELQQEILGKAIAECIQIDEVNGLTPKLD